MKTSNELTIYHCDKPKNFAEFLKRIEEKFPGIPFEKLDITFGIVFVTIKIKE